MTQIIVIVGGIAPELLLADSKSQTISLSPTITIVNKRDFHNFCTVYTARILQKIVNKWRFMSLTPQAYKPTHYSIWHCLCL
ncbi:hypothetical protein CRENPOLYSF1_480022 [Crenothrix polyspora]|uniref:Uncharacterized protein n=1 Tax=Crenothrix polyspora TaxID=360316 RepID=A0A1R4HC90_9GAMM|nr:hypothetical protein CRENPOLYSF1_480022 [Crenothrix polyspora]